MKENLRGGNLILGTPSNFAFLGCHQCSSRLLTVLLGTLWSPIKQIVIHLKSLTLLIAV